MTKIGFFIVLYVTLSLNTNAQELTKIKNEVETSLRTNMNFSQQMARANIIRRRADLNNNSGIYNTCSPVADVYIRNSLTIEDATPKGNSIYIVKGKAKTQGYLKENEIDMCSFSPNSAPPHNIIVYAEVKKILGEYQIQKLLYLWDISHFFQNSNNQQAKRTWEQRKSNISKYQGVIPYNVPNN